MRSPANTLLTLASRRIIFELYNDTAPKTSEKSVFSRPGSSDASHLAPCSFRALCTGEKGLSPTTERPLYYKNSIIHRSIKGFMIQGGGSSLTLLPQLSPPSSSPAPTAKILPSAMVPVENLYTAVHSRTRIYLALSIAQGLSPRFPSRHVRSHTRTSLLCMANKGPNTNNSQFFITLNECPHLNGTHPTPLPELGVPLHSLTALFQANTSSSDASSAGTKSQNASPSSPQTKRTAPASPS